MTTREKVAELSCLLVAVSLRQTDKDEVAAVAALCSALCGVAYHAEMTSNDVQDLVADAYELIVRQRTRPTAAGGRPS